jgi:hypothetical protein
VDKEDGVRASRACADALRRPRSLSFDPDVAVGTAAEGGTQVVLGFVEDSVGLRSTACSK